MTVELKLNFTQNGRNERDTRNIRLGLQSHLFKKLENCQTTEQLNRYDVSISALENFPGKTVLKMKMMFYFSCFGRQNCNFIVPDYDNV